MTDEMAALIRLMHRGGLANREVIWACWPKIGAGRSYSRAIKRLREATKGCECGSDLHGKEN